VEKTKSGPSAQDLQMAQNRVTIAQAAANQSRISAPFAGTVTDLSALKGDVVSPNTKLLRLDDLSNIYVDLQVTEVDVNKLQAGQAADVTLDAVPDGAYKAEVVEVGRVGATSGGVVYFTVTLRLKDADARVSPGMTASASITTASQENVLLVPNRAIRTTNSKSTVFIPGGQSGARPVSVQVGASNESMTIITSGLKEGELVITNPPSASTTTQASGFRGLFGGGGPRPSDTAPRSGATGGNQP
jgi:RND family efflux transporter MFP subunit